MQNKNAVKLGYIHLSPKSDYEKKEEKKKKKEGGGGRLLNLAHYKICLSAKLEGTRLQPPSLSHVSSFSIAQLLKLLLTPTPPLELGFVFLFLFLFQQMAQKLGLLWAWVLRR